MLRRAEISCGVFHDPSMTSPSSWIGPTRATKHGNSPWISASHPRYLPKITRVRPWSYNEQLYRRRNVIERLFRRLKGFRRIFSRYDKLDVMFAAFIHFALIAEALRPILV